MRRVVLWNVKGDVVLLRATMVIVGVRRCKMTSALPDRAERERLLHRSFETADDFRVERV